MSLRLIAPPTPPLVPREPRFKRIRLAPHLGRLQWAEGAHLMPQGPIKVRHERQPEDSARSQIDATPGVTVVRE